MGVTAYDAILGSMTIGQVESSGLSAGASVTMGHSTANHLADALYMDKAEPSISLTSSDLFTILTGVNLTTGLCLASSTITLPFAKQGCSGNLGAGNHLAISGTNGFVIVQSITGATSGEAAKATVECCLLSTDGFVIPFTSSATANLASRAFINEYRMAKVTLGGTQVTGLTNVTVNPGLAYSKRSTDGGVYPTHTYLDRVSPTIDLTFENEAAAASFGPLFKDNAAMIAYFQKKSDGGTVVAAATAGHIAISFGDNLSIADGIRAQGRNPAEVSIKCHGKQLAVALTSTIP